MERIVVLRLEVDGGEAEAALNGVPLLRLRQAPAERAGPSVGSVAVNEYTLQGANELSLTLTPRPPGAPSDAPSQPHLAARPLAAAARLLLPRVGERADPAHARSLAVVEAGIVAGDTYDAPQVHRRTVELPIAFPRWRWVDAPELADPPALAAPATKFLLGLAGALARGDVEPLLQAMRLRLEEHALAYQTSLADDVGRLRAALQAWHAEGRLVPALPEAAAWVWRAVAGGRLLEPLDTDGRPAFRVADAEGGSGRAWPMRLAHIDGRFYVLR